MSPKKELLWSLRVVYGIRGMIAGVGGAGGGAWHLVKRFVSCASWAEIGLCSCRPYLKAY